MKKIYFILIATFISAVSFAQIPNAGFETWVNNSESPHTYSVPQKWISIDALQSTFSALFGDSSYVVNSVSQTAVSHSGNYAVQMSVVQSNEGDTVAGTVISEASAFNFIDAAFGGPTAIGFPYTIRSANLTGFRKFNRVGGDSTNISVIMTKWNTVTHTRDTVADIENYIITTAAIGWTSFSIPLTYISFSNPDTCLIVAGISAAHPHPGTVFSLDDLAFSGTVSGIDETQNTSSLVSVFPNPFTTETTLNFNDVKLNHASLEFYDVLGNKVRVINDLNGDNVTFNRDGLSNGIYFYKLINNAEVISSGKISVQ